MSILDQLLGGGDNSSVSQNSDMSNTEFGANPALALAWTTCCSLPAAMTMATPANSPASVG
jgi:hypothetical protein